MWRLPVDSVPPRHPLKVNNSLALPPVYSVLHGKGKRTRRLDGNAVVSTTTTTTTTPDLDQIQPIHKLLLPTGALGTLGAGRPLNDEEECTTAFQIKILHRPNPPEASIP